MGEDQNGRTGRLHTVLKGDTLWDISDAYLGTPWVWPSIWKDNGEIKNPHRIHPGDRLWITPHETRPASDAEGAEVLAGGRATGAAPPGAVEGPA
ncbi:MAG: LysM peptidoglycan-binding domain-containing protein, partial [bacterium]|nr:LysM peptidoglycan-binding domain-containing protein [bacterium]